MVYIFIDSHMKVSSWECSRSTSTGLMRCDVKAEAEVVL